MKLFICFQFGVWIVIDMKFSGSLIVSKNFRHRNLVNLYKFSCTAKRETCLRYILWEYGFGWRSMRMATPNVKFSYVYVCIGCVCAVPKSPSCVEENPNILWPLWYIVCIWYQIFDYVSIALSIAIFTTRQIFHTFGYKVSIPLHCDITSKNHKDYQNYGKFFDNIRLPEIECSIQ